MKGPAELDPRQARRLRWFFEGKPQEKRPTLSALRRLLLRDRQLKNRARFDELMRQTFVDNWSNAEVVELPAHLLEDRKVDHG